MPNGAPVPEATVTMNANNLKTEVAAVDLRVGAHYVAVNGGWESGSPWVTDVMGVVEDRFRGFSTGRPAGGPVTVRFSDGEILQTKKGSFNESGVAQVVLGFMPYVALTGGTEATVAYGESLPVPVVVRDDAGDPIAGAAVALEATSVQSAGVLGAGDPGTAPEAL